MTIQFCTYTGPDNTIDKTAYIRSGITLTSDKLSGDQNTLQVNVVISSTTCPSWNYARIVEFNRYYFVSAPTWLADGLYQMTLTVDPLYTYRSRIMDLSGVCQYSANGSPLLYDPRLVYNEPPSVSRLDPAPLSGFSINGGAWWVMITYDYYDIAEDIAVRRPTTNRRYMIMPLIEYWDFCSGYALKPEQYRIAIGNAIKSIVLLRWFNTAGLTPVPATDPANPGTAYVNFMTPEILNIDAVSRSGINIGVTADTVYVLEYDTITKPYPLAFFIQPARYWDRKAKRAVWIPHVGTASLDLDLLGVGFVTAGYIGYEIGFDFTSNMYVLTPGTAPLGRDIATQGFARTFPASATKVSNMATVSWASDTSAQFVDSAGTQQLLGLGAQVVGGVAAAVATGGASIPASVAGLTVGLTNFNISQERLQYQQAASFVSQGTANGGIPDRVYRAWEGSPPVPKDPAAYMEILTNGPAPGSEAFQQRFGYPDGAYRSISGLHGYFVMANPVLTGFGDVSEAEKDRIRAALAGGVFVD